MAVRGVAGPVARDRHPRPVDQRERRFGRRFVVEVAERHVAGAGDPPDLVLADVEEPCPVGRQQPRRVGRGEGLGVDALGDGLARRHHPDLGRAVAVADGDVGEELEERAAWLRSSWAVPPVPSTARPERS